MGVAIKIIECPRDAMQGWPKPISTADKVHYLNQLLQVGFDTLDCVSFVSPKAIPQMADSAEVLRQLDMANTKSKLLAIVANVKGAEMAVGFDSISYLGFPFSISQTFQQLNTNSSIEESWERVQKIQSLCVANGKNLVVYISMGFGNPYGDPYNADLIAHWVQKMEAEGINIVSLADTVGLATSSQIYNITRATVDAFPQLTVGVHLHSTSSGFLEKMEAALLAGCTRFDGAMKGIGGCPMANNELVGNMDTERIIDYLESKGHNLGFNKEALAVSGFIASKLFNS